MIIKTEIGGTNRVVVSCGSKRCDYNKDAFILHNNIPALMRLVEIISIQAKKHEEKPSHTVTIELFANLALAHILVLS